MLDMLAAEVKARDRRLEIGRQSLLVTKPSKNLKGTR
jgi:hypothetical protein